MLIFICVLLQLISRKDHGVEKFRKAGILVLTNIPDMGIAGVSQTRGAYNLKKLRPQSFPCASQVTAYGKCKVGESFAETIQRETREELGEKACDIILPKGWTKKSNLKRVYASASSIHEIQIFALYIKDHTFLQEIRTEPSCGEIRLIFPKKLSSIRKLKESDKNDGMMHFPRTKLGMTEDTYSAFLGAFAIFAK